jgi:hypothetical protein
MTGIRDAALVYGAAVQRNPFLVNAACGAMFAGLGDLAGQTMEKRGDNDFTFSATRVRNIALIRVFLAVPWILFWYPRLENLAPGSDNLSLAYRVLIDFLVGTPVMIFIVFAGNAVLTGQSLPEAVALFKQRFLPTYKKGAQFWPFVHFFVTYRLELIYRPLFAAVASMYWNAVLSWSATRNLENRKK